MTTTDFKNALKKVYESGELEKIINTSHKDYIGKSRAYVRHNRREAKELKEALDYMTERGDDIKNFSFIALLYNIDSAEILKTIILNMIGEGGAANENK